MPKDEFKRLIETAKELFKQKRLNEGSYDLNADISKALGEIIQFYLTEKGYNIKIYHLTSITDNKWEYVASGIDDGGYKITKAILFLDDGKGNGSKVHLINENNVAFMVE